MLCCRKRAFRKGFLGLEAIVLAGGLGTRLRGVVSDLPKPMAPIGGKPFLEYIIHYLKKNGIKRIVLSVGYKWERIRAYFADYFDGIEIVYSIEGEPLGTGGAIIKAMDHVNDRKVYIINGDTFFDVPLNVLWQEFQLNSKLMLSLKKMHNFDRYGCVESNVDGLVQAFSEKGYRKIGNINGGIYLSSKDVFEGFVLEEKFSFEAFMEEHYKILHIRALVFSSYFIDIGIPEDYARAQNELKIYL